MLLTAYNDVVSQQRTRRSNQAPLLSRGNPLAENAGGLWPRTMLSPAPLTDWFKSLSHSHSHLAPSADCPLKPSFFTSLSVLHHFAGGVEKGAQRTRKGRKKVRHRPEEGEDRNRKTETERCGTKKGKNGSNMYARGYDLYDACGEGDADAVRRLLPLITTQELNEIYDGVSGTMHPSFPFSLLHTHGGFLKADAASGSGFHKHPPSKHTTPIAHHPKHPI